MHATSVDISSHQASNAETARPGAPVSGAQLRAAMSRFATGVTVVTTLDADDRPYGTTANAVSSVSLDPPLVLVCLRRESETLAAIRRRARFAIHLLDSGQQELAERFAKRTDSATWAPVPHHRHDGLPILPGGLATLRCELHSAADGGDHEIVIGRVMRIDDGRQPSEPLVYFRGGFQRLPLPPRPDDGLLEVSLPSRRGALTIVPLADDAAQTSVAVLTGSPRGRSGVLLYVHDGCVLGDALGGICVGRRRLDEALAAMQREGQGVAVYHRDHSGALSTCCFAGSQGGAELSEGALVAAAQAARQFELCQVRLLGSPSAAERLRHSGVDIVDVLPTPAGDDD
jgi:flavin reductase (DIM6/NTAB) family NADH-FMN oxidoreductase RutF/GTP cyclohydrolase II